MLRKILNTAVTAIEASAIGLVVGPIAAATLGWIFGYLSVPPKYRQDEAAALAFLFALFGAVAGPVASAGISILGVRTKRGLEWPLIVGGGVLVGLAVSASGVGAQIIGIAVGTAAAAWLTVCLIKRVFARRIARGSLDRWVIAAYVAVFVSVALLVLEIATTMHRLVS